MTTTNRPATVTAAVLLPIAITLTVSGCKDSNTTQGQEPASAAVTPEAPAPAAIDGRSQYDLVAKIAEAERMDPEEADLLYQEIRDEWHGKRYQWRVFRVPALCSGSHRCNVMPFDLAGADRGKVVQGWMPQLELSADDYAAIESRCAGKSRCSFQFEGTLSKLVLSTEHLTSLGFRDVRIL